MSRRLRRALGLAVVLVAAVAAAAAAVVHAPASEGSAAPAPQAVAQCRSAAAGNHRVRVESDRVPVLLHVPSHAPAGRLPLILVLPGASMDGRGMADYTGYSQLADQRGFLVAYPTASGSRTFWNVSGQEPGRPDDVAYLRHVITALTSTAACGDRARVGMTGVSNGGGMTARMACDAADLLAAAAPVAGGYSTLPACQPSRPLPILEIHGLRDAVVPYDGKAPDHAGAVGPYVRAWRRRDGCASPARRSAPAPNVRELRWTCPNGLLVVHDRVVDAEHGWPGEASLRAFSSTKRTWRFLTRFRDERAG